MELFKSKNTFKKMNIQMNYFNIEKHKRLWEDFVRTENINKRLDFATLEE